MAQFRGQLTKAQDARRFAEAGNSTLTLVSTLSDQRFTYKVQAPHAPGNEGTNARRDTGNEFRFVKVLTGSDNENSYTYLGYIRRGVFFHGGTKARIGRDALSFKAFDYFWRNVVIGCIPHKLEVWHEGACAACGRKLTVPASVATGFGPDCAERLGIPMCEAA